MRLLKSCFAFLWLPVMILGNTVHVPRDYSLLQAAVTGSGDGDTIVCDTVNDFDTIRIIGKTGIVITGPAAAPPTKITKVVYISKSTCVLSLLSIYGAKGVDGNNNNSCRSVPAMDGKDGTDAIIADSSTVTISGCTARGGDGGSYGASYQGTMLCSCGSKGAPGSALKASSSTVFLTNDSLLSGNCSGISLAGCFTNSCAVLGYGCAAQNLSTVDTTASLINSVQLDSTSSMGGVTGTAEGRRECMSSAIPRGMYLSVSGRLSIPETIRPPFAVSAYDAKGDLVFLRKGIDTRQLDLGGMLDQGAYIVCLQCGGGRLMFRFVNFRTDCREIR